MVTKKCIFVHVLTTQKVLIFSMSTLLYYVLLQLRFCSRSTNKPYSHSNTLSSRYISSGQSSFISIPFL